MISCEVVRPASMSACISPTVLPTTSYGDVVTSLGACGAACVSSLGMSAQSPGSKPSTAPAIASGVQFAREQSWAVVRSPSVGLPARPAALVVTAATSTPAAGRALSLSLPVPCRSRWPITTKRASERVSPAASVNR